MTADIRIRGVTEVKIYGRSKRVVRLVACPFCPYEFDENEPRWRHFLDEHDPEDAGLTPLGHRTTDDPELVTDGGTTRASKPFTVENHTTAALSVADELDEDFARVRYHLREALQALTAAQEVPSDE